MKRTPLIVAISAVLLSFAASFAIGSSASTDTDPLITLSYLEQVAMPKLKSEILSQVSGNTANAVNKTGSYAVIELKKGQVVYADSVCEFIVRPGSQVSCVSPFPNQGIADITLGNEILNNVNIPINSYCLIPRGSDGRGFKILSEKAYIMIRGDYRIG